MLIIEVKREEFLNGIQIVEKAISDNKIRPAISGVYIETQENRILMRGTDLELTIETFVNAEIVDGGRAVFSYELAQEYLKQIKDEKVKIAIDEGKMTVETSDSSSEFSIYDVEEYPIIRALNEGKTIIADKETFVKSLEKTRIGAEISTENLSLNCIRFETDGKKIKMIASDTFRMVYNEEELEQEFHDVEIKVSVPLKTVDGLIKIIKIIDTNEMTVRQEGSQIAFIFGETTVLSRIIELQFPNYTGVIGAFGFTKSVKADTDELIMVLKRAQIFARGNIDAKNGAIFNFVGNKLVIRAISDKAKLKEEANIEKEGEDIKISLNVKFLLDFLAQYEEDTIELRMSNSDSAVLMKSNKNDKYLYLTMPLALNDA
jgi:DNA polymerase-3 subunit beta